MLFIRPIQALLTHETNLLLAMDPYLVLLYQGKQVKTAPHFGGGNKPKWSQTFRLEIKGINRLKVEAWSRSVIGNDSQIGKGEVDLRRFMLVPGRAVQQYIDIFFQGKHAGKVLIEVALTTQAKQKRPLIQQQLRTSMPNFPNLNPITAKLMTKPENSSAGFLFGFGGNKQPTQNKPPMTNQVKQMLDRQVLNNFAKINLNASQPNLPVNYPQNKQPGLAHHRPMQRPGTPQYHQMINKMPQQIPVKDPMVKIPEQKQKQSQDLDLKHRISYNQRQNNFMNKSEKTQRVGIGKTPPKPILSKSKDRKKSRSNKKVTFDI